MSNYALTPPAREAIQIGSFCEAVPDMSVYLRGIDPSDESTMVHATEVRDRLLRAAIELDKSLGHVALR